MNYRDKLLRPNIGNYRILAILKKSGDGIPIYSTNNYKESMETSKIHNKLHALREAGFVTYERGSGEYAGYMYAAITFKGIDWIYRRRIDFVIAIASIIAAVFGVLGFARPH